MDPDLASVGSLPRFSAELCSAGATAKTAEARFPLVRLFLFKWSEREATVQAKALAKRLRRIRRGALEFEVISAGQIWLRPLR